jgi:RNA polymerase sigma factor (sigma-70 family)
MDVNQLIKDNTALVIYLADKFRPENTNERDEFISAGMIGLWKAIERFDPLKGKLTTIAWYRINREILKYIKQRKRYSTKHSSLPITGKQAKEKFNIDEIIPNLTPIEARLIQYRRHGYRIKEIASLENLEVKEINKIYSRTLRKIRASNT